MELKQEYLYTLGRGTLQLSTDGNNFQYVGATSEFKITLSTEQIEHENYEHAIKTIDKTVLTKATATGSIVCDETTKQNVQRFLMGTLEENEIPQSNVTKREINYIKNYTYLLDEEIDDVKCYEASEILTDTVEKVDPSYGEITVELLGTAVVGSYVITAEEVEENLIFKLYQDGTEIENTICEIENVDGQAGQSWTLVITQETQYTEYPNMTVDKTNGLIQIDKSGTFFLDYTIKPHTETNILAGNSVENLYFHILYIGDPATGSKQRVIGYCMVKPSGDMGFKGDEFEKLTFEVTFNQNKKYNSTLGFIYQDRGRVN